MMFLMSSQSWATSCEKPHRNIYRIDMSVFKSRFSILFSNKLYHDNENKITLKSSPLLNTNEQPRKVLLFRLKLSRPKYKHYTKLENIVVVDGLNLFLLEHPENSDYFGVNRVYGYGENGLAIYGKINNITYKSYYIKHKSVLIGLQCYFRNNKLYKTYHFRGSVAKKVKR